MLELTLQCCKCVGIKPMNLRLEACGKQIKYGRFGKTEPIILELKEYGNQTPGDGLNPSP